jgi:hypothetical protein
MLLHLKVFENFHLANNFCDTTPPENSPNAKEHPQKISFIRE